MGVGDSNERLSSLTLGVSRHWLVLRASKVRDRENSPLGLLDGPAPAREVGAISKAGRLWASGGSRWAQEPHQAIQLQLFITPEIIIKQGVPSHLIYAQEKPSPLVLLTPHFTEEETGVSVVM